MFESLKNRMIFREEQKLNENMLNLICEDEDVDDEIIGVVNPDIITEPSVIVSQNEDHDEDVEQLNADLDEIISDEDEDEYLKKEINLVESFTNN